MLIDNIMPLYHFNEVQSIIVRSNSRSNILNAVRDVTPKEIPFLFELFWLRGLSSYIILGKRYKFSINRKRLLFEQFLASGQLYLVSRNLLCISYMQIDKQ
ncbi:MAG: hypothetical protein ACJ71L_15190 [Nitrososphaeraceae archaeon]